jgi:hypothetical protein
MMVCIFLDGFWSVGAFDSSGYAILCEKVIGRFNMLYVSWLRTIIFWPMLITAVLV